MTERVMFDCMIFLQAAAREQSPARECLRFVETGSITLCLSPAILSEVGEVLSRPELRQRFPGLSPAWTDKFLETVGTNAVVMPDAPHQFDLPRDQKDEPYVDLAIATQCRYLVSYDRDLLDLMNDASFRKRFPNLRILDPVAFLQSLCKPSVPTQGTLLGLDYGTKRIGVAVSTPDQTIASPLENYTRRKEAEDAAFLKRVAKEYQAVGLIVGLPVHMSGDEGTKAKEARAFGEWAARACALPVVYWDERYSSAMAELYLQQAEVSPKKRKQRLDKVAAQVMLKTFLESDDRGRAPGRWSN